MTTHAPTASSKKDVCCNRSSGTEEQDHSRLQSIIVCIVLLATPPTVSISLSSQKELIFYCHVVTKGEKY